GKLWAAACPAVIDATRRGRSPDLRQWLYRVGAFRARLEPRLQARLDELVQVAVQHLLRVAALDARAQVLDPRLVEHVVADLAAPADVGLRGLQRVLFGITLLHFELVELGRQHLHRAVAVGVLAALGLAGDHDAGRHVGDAHRRLGLVDVLAAGARGAVRSEARRVGKGGEARGGGTEYKW